MSPETFWLLLWGEEAYPFSQWRGEECPITRSRFNEALERVNKYILHTAKQCEHMPGDRDAGGCATCEVIRELEGEC